MNSGIREPANAAHPAQSNELLGLPGDARVLIINADDFGMYPAVNAAVIRSIEEGVASSCSLMAPCPAAPHAMDLLRQHPRIPFGIHLTLVCDIPGIGWEPLAAREKVSSLLSDTGELFAPAQLPRLLVQARLDEVELEFRAQVDAVADAGLTPTHLDWHCLADGGRDDIFDLTVALAYEYGLAVRAWLEPARRKLRQRGLPAVDHEFLDSFRLGTDGKPGRYAMLLHDLPAGLSEWAVHPALGDEQSQMIDPGWRVRRTDYEFLTSPQARALLENEHIVVIDYRTIQRIWYRGPGRLPAVLGVKDGVAIRLGPLSQHRDRIDQGTAELGELVFDSGRGLGIGMPGHQPAALEPAQRVREHLAGDAADQPGQLAVPSRLVGEAVQDHDGPLIGDDLNGQPGRAVGQEAVSSGGITDMRSIRQQAFGGPEVLEITEVARPVPLPTEMLVRVRAVGVNPVETVIRSGQFPLLGPPPFVLGWDVSGVVEDVEPGVTRFQPGDEVYGMPFFPRAASAYAEYVAAPSRQLARKPAGLSHAEAAALPLAGLTAWQAASGTWRSRSPRLAAPT